MHSGDRMSPSDRAENAALICCHFARNLAYYNATRTVLPLGREGFWLTIPGNFIDISVLEWSKLFGNQNGTCHWKKVLKQSEEFKQDFMACHHLDDATWTNLWKNVKDYRDDFIAHVEDQKTTPVPCMTVPYLLVKFYFERLQSEFSELLSLDNLPRSMDTYYDSNLFEAKMILAACRATR